MKLLVATSESISADRSFRIPYLRTTFGEIAKIQTDYTRIVLYVNDVTDQELADFDRNFDDINVDIEYRRVIRQWYHFSVMCWEHKELIEPFTQSDYTHFLYYENDIKVTDENFQYWLETRDLFKRNNLNFYPAFLRIELDEQGQIFSLDVTEPNILAVVEVEGQRFVSLAQPYHGMYLVDRDMALEHLSSPLFGHFRPYRNKEVFKGLGQAESAATGPAYDAVPEGFEHRCLIPVSNFYRCWVHHLPNFYVKNRPLNFGTLPVARVLGQTSLI